MHETRGWNEETGVTTRLRGKEEAHDYRYFPDPDLPPLALDASTIELARASQPELPRAKRDRFVAMGLPPAAAQVLTAHPRVAAFFEEAATLHGRPPRVASFVASEVLRDVQTHGLGRRSSLVTAAQVAGLLRLVDSGAISGKQAKEAYAALLHTTRTADEVVDALGLRQVSDAGVLEAACRKVLDAHPRQAEQMRAGKRGLMGFFVGLVMKETGGSANPRLVTETIDRLVNSGDLGAPPAGGWPTLPAYASAVVTLLASPRPPRRRAPACSSSTTTSSSSGRSTRSS